MTQNTDDFLENQLPKLRRSCFKILKAYTPGEQPQNVSEWTKLNTNENPFEPPKSVQDALQEAISSRLRMYPDPTAKELRIQIALNYLKDYPHVQSLENITVANGSDEMLDILFKTFIEPGDGVIYFNPSYGMYPVLAETYEAIKVVYPLDKEDYSIGELEFKPKDKILIVCSPNNPNGDSVPLSKLSEICTNFHGIVFVDEAYGDFAETSAMALLDDHPNLIVGKTFSKSSSLASIRLGFAVAHKKIIELFDTIRLPYNVSYLTQVAGIAAMQAWEEITKNVEIIKNERKRTMDTLSRMGYTLLPSQANFYLMRFDTAELASRVFQTLKDMKILTRYWSKPALKRVMRVTVGTPTQNDKFLEAMKSFIKWATNQIPKL